MPHALAPYLAHPQTCYAIASAPRKDKGDGSVNAALFRLGADRLKAHYAKSNKVLLPIGEEGDPSSVNPSQAGGDS